MHLHELYDTAVEAYSNRPSDLRKILDLRGDWLMKDDRCHEAALCESPFSQRSNVLNSSTVAYTLAKQPKKAMIAHQRALTWQELFEIAMTQQLNAQEIGQLAQNVASALRTKGRHAEAGRVLVEYGRDVKEAVVVLSEGNEFSEAIRIVSGARLRYVIPLSLIYRHHCTPLRLFYPPLSCLRCLKLSSA